jgi:hypothetical protein
MRLLARGWGASVRFRYPLIGAWAAAWFLVYLLPTVHHTPGDWGFFEYGARTLVHYDAHYSDGPLHLYAKDPQIQVGPLPLALVAGVIRVFPPHVVGVLFATVMFGLGLLCVRLAELTAAGAGVAASRVKPAVLVGGLIATAFWSVDVATFRHLDDALAITAILAAAALIARDGATLWIGALVGVALASKPWALALTPLLLGVPARDRARCALAALAVAAVAWGPFVLADHATVNALGSFRLLVAAHSALHTIGVHAVIAPGWVRPGQLVGGFLVGVLIARQGRWSAVPLAGVAARVMVDPQVWSYYGMGPTMCALLLDLTSAATVPWRTASAVTAMYVVPAALPAATGPARLAWAAVVLLGLLRPLAARRPLIWSAWLRPTTSRTA